MKDIDKMTSKDEVERAYADAIRNMSFGDILALQDEPEETELDSNLVRHAKACYRKINQFQSGVAVHRSDEPPSVAM